MRVCLYETHNHLPTGCEPTQPMQMFVLPMAYWTTRLDEERTHTVQDVRAKDHHMWPVLIGLHLIQGPYLGHVSVHFDPKDKTFRLPERVVVDITAVPGGAASNRIPLIVERSQVLVTMLWSSSGTRSPYQIAAKEMASDERLAMPEFWAGLFMRNLREREEKSAKLGDAVLGVVLPFRQRKSETA